MRVGILCCSLLKLFYQSSCQQSLFAASSYALAPFGVLCFIRHFLISALQELGFKLTILLGAAGLLTVSLGFASQTAASNLISGFFLLFERPFHIGDTIEVKNLVGTVESIDLLSTKIKTANNTLIRIPNETMMKSEIINSSFYYTRRIDLVVRVAYKTGIEYAKSILLNVAQQEGILETPAPTVIVDKFSESAIELRLMVWVQTAAANKLKNQLYEDIKNRFEMENIIIPDPLAEH